VFERGRFEGGSFEGGRFERVLLVLAFLGGLGELRRELRNVKFLTSGGARRRVVLDKC
jgi:hypothetical protein